MPIENMAASPEAAPVTSTPESTAEVNQPVSQAGEAVKPVEAAKPVSMDDTIRAKLKELNAPKQEESKVPTGERARGPDGKFVKAEGTTEVAAEGESAADDAEKAPELATDAKKAADDAKKAAEAAKPVVPPGLEKAPTSWKKEAAAKWEALDPEIKAEIHRREANFHEGFKPLQEKAQIGELFHKEFAPYEAMIRAAGTTPQDLTRQWLNVEYQLKTGSAEQKGAIFANALSQYGIDIQHVNTALQKLADGKPATEAPHPEVLKLKQQLDSLSQTLEKQNSEVAQREAAAVQAEIQAFAQSPDHPHYEAVKLDMAALLKEGRAKTLQDAYDKAIYMVPEVREAILAQQLEQRTKQAAEKAAAARKASSTNVASRGTLPVAPVVSTNMEDTIRNRLKELNAMT